MNQKRGAGKIENTANEVIVLAFYKRFTVLYLSRECLQSMNSVNRGKLERISCKVKLIESSAVTPIRTALSPFESATQNIIELG